MLVTILLANSIITWTINTSGSLWFSYPKWNRVQEARWGSKGKQEQTINDPVVLDKEFRLYVLWDKELRQKPVTYSPILFPFFLGKRLQWATFPRLPLVRCGHVTNVWPMGYEWKFLLHFQAWTIKTSHLFPRSSFSQLEVKDYRDLKVGRVNRRKEPGSLAHHIESCPTE